VPLDQPKEAEAYVELLESQGWSPVFVYEQQGSQWLKVRIGRFETVPDAAWWRLALVNRGYKDAYIANVAFTSGTLQAEGARGPLVPNFKTPKSFAQTDRAALTSVRDSLTSQCKGVLDRFVSQTPEWHTGTDTDTVTLVHALQPVADGEVPASKQEICRARIAIAHAWHYGKRRWLTSYHCYGEALALSEPGSQEEAECLLQRAALLMELTNSGLGTMEDARRATEIVMERVPKENERAHAVAELMHAETLFEEKKYEEALVEFFNLQEKWADKRWREVAGAQVYAGICAANLGRYAEAESFLRPIFSMPLKPEESWYWRGKRRDLEEDAAGWMAIVCTRQGRPEEGAAWGRFAAARRADPSASFPPELEARP